MSLVLESSCLTCLVTTSAFFFGGGHLFGLNVGLIVWLLIVATYI